MEGFLTSPNDFRDALARIQYVSTSIGVEIGWNFAGAMINVAFIELLHPGVFPASWTLFEGFPNAARAVSLYEIAEMLGHSDDSDFLLQDRDNSRKWKKHLKLFETRMSDVLAGLARATQTYASDILKGDTTIFPEAMDYYTSKVR